MTDYRGRSRSRSRSPAPASPRDNYPTMEDRGYADINRNGGDDYDAAGPAAGGATSAGSEKVILYVGNLDYATTEESLQAEFGIFGPVVGVSIPVDRTNNRPRGYGFVTMASRQDAQDAIVKMDQSEFQGRTIRVSESRPKRDGPPSTGAPRGGGGDYRSGGGGYSGGYDSSSRGPDRDAGRSAGGSSSNVQFWVGNLSFRTTDRTLFNLFRPYGDVVECNVPIHRETGKPRGYGFVTVASKSASPRDVTRICSELDGTELDGRNISVMEARDKNRDRGPPPSSSSSFRRGADRGRGDGYEGGRRDFGGRDDYRSSSKFDGGDRNGGRGRGDYDRGGDYSGGSDRGRDNFSKGGGEGYRRDYNDV